ncbi:MAG: phage tail assembly chaperone [Asticcacaulis sp.]
MLRQAVFGLRLSPEDFWRLSWREWVCLNSLPSGNGVPFAVSDLETLMRLSPDDHITD